jgi:hypothetical protein
MLVRRLINASHMAYTYLRFLEFAREQDHSRPDETDGISEDVECQASSPERHRTFELLRAYTRSKWDCRYTNRGEGAICNADIHARNVL